jgi:hypothetical protein
MADCHAVARKLEDASTSSPLHRWPDVSHWQQVARARRKVAVDIEPTVTSSALAGRAVARAWDVDEDGRVVRAGCQEHGAQRPAPAARPAVAVRGWGCGARARVAINGDVSPKNTSANSFRYVQAISK